MLNHKKNICFWVAFLMMISITACGPEDPKELDNSTPDSEKNTVSAEKASLADTPDHIGKLYSKNFVVDADVHVPDVQNADVLFAKYRNFDEQTLLSFFYSGKTPDKEIAYSEDNTIYRDDSSYIIFSSGHISYGTKDLDYVKYPTENFITKNETFSANKRFDEVYVQENLGFMTRAEVSQTVSDVLRKLSIDITDNTEIHAIDSETMQMQQDERIQKDIDYQRSMDISPIQDPADDYQIKKEFTQEDDFYKLYFTMTQNGIPITQKSYMIMAGERELMGSTARVSFSEKGIIELSCSGIYQSQGIAESPEALVSVEKAVQKAYEIHKAIISTDKVTIAAIDFEYVPVPYNENYDEVMLTPAWRLTLNCEHDMPSREGKEGSQPSAMTRMVFINAVTGEEIK